MEKDYSIFAQRLILLRKQKKLTQGALAKKIGLKSKSSISNYESGNKQPRENVKLKLCIFFNCSMDYLMGYTNIEHPSEKIEKELSELNLSKDDYLQVLDTWLKDNICYLPNINKYSSKIDKANAIIFDVYLDYLKQRPAKEDASVEEARTNTDVVDESFLQMLYSLDESKFIKEKKYTIPIYGTIPAGIPMEMIDNIIDYEELSPNMFTGDKEYFGLKIKGDSMSPDYLDGDIIILQKTNDCENGDDCVVSIDGTEATFKRVRKNKTGISLYPLNNKYSPRDYTNEEIEKLPVKILGVFEELRRKKKKSNYYY